MYNQTKHISDSIEDWYRATKDGRDNIKSEDGSWFNSQAPVCLHNKMFRMTGAWLGSPSRESYPSLYMQSDHRHVRIYRRLVQKY